MQGSQPRFPAEPQATQGFAFCGRNPTDRTLTLSLFSFPVPFAMSSLKILCGEIAQMKGLRNIPAGSPTPSWGLEISRWIHVVCPGPNGFLGRGFSTADMGTVPGRRGKWDLSMLLVSAISSAPISLPHDDWLVASQSEASLGVFSGLLGHILPCLPGHRVRCW